MLHVDINRGKIIGIWESGKSKREILALAEFRESTMYKLIIQWQQKGLMEIRHHFGRPKATTYDEEEVVVNAAGD